MKTKKLTFMALLLAIALTSFVVEARIPPIVPIAGVKLGLSNIVTLAALVWLGRGEAFTILVLRIVMGSVFAGQAVSFMYSLGGGLLCFLTMAIAMKLLSKKSLWVVSVFGAISHNIGQIAIAAVLTGSIGVIAYLPVLIISGVITGAVTGLAAQLVTERIKYK